MDGEAPQQTLAHFAADLESDLTLQFGLPLPVGLRFSKSADEPVLYCQKQTGLSLALLRPFAPPLRPSSWLR